MKKLLMSAAIAALSVGTAHAAVPQILLSPANVTGSTGYYGSPSSQFDPGDIFDEQTGVITEDQQRLYWINPDNGPAAAAISIDLGEAYKLRSFQLFNTHNAQYNDRGTGDFSITGSNDGVNFFTVISGTLAAESSSNPTLTAQTFAAGGTAYRYLRFLPTSVATAFDGVHTSPCCNTNGTVTEYGLHELRVFGSVVPEPATWAIMILGLGAVGGMMRRRHSTKVAYA